MFCFRAPRGNPLQLDDDRPEAVRRVSSSKKVNRFKRVDSADSRMSSASSKSNESISKLPPCRRSSAKVEAMMMPVPIQERPSQCLRLSHPKIYGSLVSDMKCTMKCRDWRNFATFYNDDVDMSISADEAARQKALEYRRQWGQLNSSFPKVCVVREVDAVDMIG